MANSYLTVNSVDLGPSKAVNPTAAWWIVDLDAAMNTGASLLGADRPLYKGAIKSYPRYKTATRRQYQMVIDGAYDHTGAVQSDPRMGCTVNSEYLMANIGYGLTTGDGRVTAVWHRFDGTTKSASVTVEDFALGEVDKRCHLKAVLTLTIDPAGFA